MQTALTGGDIYYWFIAGFGDMDRLKNSRFSAIDSPTIDAIISLIVQGFFCYRIWTLNKRMWWVCVIVSIVRTIRSLSSISDVSLPSFLCYKRLGQHGVALKLVTPNYQCLYLTHSSVCYAWKICSHQASSIRMHFGLRRAVPCSDSFCISFG